MASLTVNIPEELLSRVESRREQLPAILDFGLRELESDPSRGFEGLTDVLEFLASLPAPQQVMDLRPSPEFQAQISQLVEKSRTGALTPQDEQNWERYEFVEHLVRMAKASAKAKLSQGR